MPVLFENSFDQRGTFARCVESVFPRSQKRKGPFVRSRPVLSNGEVSLIMVESGTGMAGQCLLSVFSLDRGEMWVGYIEPVYL